MCPMLFGGHNPLEIGNWDIGLSHFYGTSRDPSFLVKAKKDGRISHNSLL